MAERFPGDGTARNGFGRRQLHEDEARLLFEAEYPAPPDMRAPGNWRLSAGGVPVPPVPTGGKKVRLSFPAPTANTHPPPAARREADTPPSPVHPPCRLPSLPFPSLARHPSNQQRELHRTPPRQIAAAVQSKQHPLPSPLPSSSSSQPRRAPPSQRASTRNSIPPSPPNLALPPPNAHSFFPLPCLHRRGGRSVGRGNGRRRRWREAAPGRSHRRRGGGGHGGAGAGAVRGGEEQREGAGAGAHPGAPRRRHRQLRRAGLRRHAHGRRAIPGQEGHGMRRVPRQVQVQVRPPRRPPARPRRVLLRAQVMERAAGGGGGGADRGHGGRAAANHGHAGGLPGHAVPRQAQHPVGAGEPCLRGVAEADGGEGRRRGRGGGEAGLAGVDAAPRRARGVRALDQQQRRVRPPVRRAGGIRQELPRPRPDPGARRLRPLHPALHHLVLPRGVPAHAPVPVPVHQPRQVLRAGPGGGLRGGVRGEAGGGGEPAAAVRAPGGERERAAVGVVGLRHGLQAAVLHEGEEVQQGVRGGGGGVARAVAGQGAGVHGRPRRRRRQRRALQGAAGPDRARVEGRRHHPAHARHQRRPVQREAGEDGGAQGHLRRLQGGDRAASLPQPRHGDERVPAPERRVLAGRGDERDGVQGHVPGQGVRVPRGERRPLRRRRVHPLQSCRSGQVRAEPRRLLVGDQGGPHLLRMLGHRAERVPVPAGVPRRRPQMRRPGRVQGEAGVHLPGLPLQEHLGQLRVRVQGQPGVHPRGGRVRGQQHVQVRLARRRPRRVLRRRPGSRRLRLLQVQAQVVHGLGDHGHHVAVHAARQPEQRAPAAPAACSRRLKAIDG